ncbi:unnamed protein product [Dibothriocephalus latus]|uniref:SSD domain-containing protein n=1 Tax=Dibothriocephalus latus TaxID=60516 RepID=A0A3P6PFH1_DIBLA|nr:unnamed protein product [Dibothriocephalus latus]
MYAPCLLSPSFKIPIVTRTDKAIGGIYGRSFDISCHHLLEITVPQNTVSIAYERSSHKSKALIPFPSIAFCVFLTPKSAKDMCTDKLIRYSASENIIDLAHNAPSPSLFYSTGLAKEGWPITRRLLTQLGCIALGFLTFNPDIQEFCLIAVVGLTTQFFLHLFFFVPVLAVDIRRIEVCYLSVSQPITYFPTVFFLELPSLFIPSQRVTVIITLSITDGFVLNSRGRLSLGLLASFLSESMLGLEGLY